MTRSLVLALTSHPTFEGFQTYVAGVGPALLVLAGFVADESALLSEAMFAHVAAVGTLAGVSPVVFVQTRWFPVNLVRDAFPTFHTVKPTRGVCDGSSRCYLACGRSCRTGDTGTASRRCARAGAWSGCSSGRTRGRTCCTQTVARFCERKPISRGAKIFTFWILVKLWIHVWKKILQ